MRWGSRVTPLAESDVELPPSRRTALEMINDLRARKAATREPSAAGLNDVRLPDHR